MNESTASADAPIGSFRHIVVSLSVWLEGLWRAVSPAARAADAYTHARARLIREASLRALEGAADWHAPRVGGAYGSGLDERVVEYPWAYERLGRGERLLDVGSTLNTAFHLDLVRRRFREVVVLNPYRDDGYRSVQGGVSYVASDIRSHYLRPAGFDRVTCLSTLEHVGCDNERYGGPPAGRVSREESRAMRAHAMRAMRELLGPGGSLLLTVPFGRYEDYGWLVQLDGIELDHAVQAFAPGRIAITYFRYGDGWSVAERAECENQRYGASLPGASAVACVELQP